MKRSVIFTCLCLLSPIAMAGESGLTRTFQPLDGLGSGSIHIVEVVCHDWYSHSGQATAIALVSARNVPPTNNPKEATENINLASACGLHFSTGDLEEKPGLRLDARAFVIPKSFEHPREDILKASLECLRRCLPASLMKTPVILTATPENREWMGKIVDEFNRHNRKKMFFVPTK